VKRTRRSVGNFALGGLGAAGLGIMALGGASGAPAGVATTPLLRPANWPSHHHGIGAKPHGSTGGSSAVGWYSSNWSGYAVTPSGATPFTGITSQWTVPTVARTRNATFSAAWAGIDGFSNSSLIQTGTEQDYYNGAAHYAAWWTTSAQGFAEQPLPSQYAIAPHDQMTANIAETAPGSGTWTIALSDATKGWTFSTTVAYSGPGTSAEWITEAPTVGGRLAPLAHYSSPLTFDPGTITVGTTTASPNLIPVDGGEMIQGRSIVSVPSVPDTELKPLQPDGFNMAYGSIAPAPPTS